MSSNQPQPSPDSPTPPPASKAYQPSAVEPRVIAKWDASGAFHADPAKVLSGEKKPYCILIPPPNVTGALHLGHALNNTLQDILTRAHRMMGYEALWMPGTDHAGIATQAVVERRLRKEGKLKGPLKTSMTREQFVEQVQQWKDEYEARITGQLKAMGCSCDYARQRFTMDPICARAVREAFFRLFKDGLIYRGKRLVNWDPALQTAVADDECYDEEVETSFWYLRYPIVQTHSLSSIVEALRRESDSVGRVQLVMQLEKQMGIDVPQGLDTLDDVIAHLKKHHHGEILHHAPVTWDELATRGYPGAEQHPGDQPAWVTVATTRPETYLGDTAVAVNPHDPRAKALRGLQAELPLVGRVIPIVEDSYVVLPEHLARNEEEKNDPKATFATGFLKVTPAHDQNDAELGQRHNLPAINMMSPDGKVSDKHGWTDIGDAHLFVGLSMAEARKKVVAEFEARGLLEATKPYRQSKTFSDRSKAVIEPYLSDQWYVRVTDDRLAGAANRALVADQRSGVGATGAAMGAESKHGRDARATAAGNGSMRFYPARYAKTYEQWHDNIRDWCISRQLWWGHRIPVWRTGPAWVGDPNLRTRLEAWQKAGRLWFRYESDARKVAAILSSPHPDPRATTSFAEHEYAEGQKPSTFFVCIKDPNDTEVLNTVEAAGLEQDPDVLDTWFSSALWPLSTMGWPDPEQSDGTRGVLAAFNPTSVLSTAREIITLWVSRMVMMNRYFTPPGDGGGQIPFHDVFIHAVVQDGEGRKMSKSLSNGVDPLDIIESHGADAMRFTLAQMTTSTQDVRMPVRKDSKTGKNTSEKFDAGRALCNKLWNASTGVVIPRLVKGAAEKHSAPGSESRATLVDRWMLSRLARAVSACEAALKGYEFSDYCQTLYQLLWWDFCDWYLEAIKPTVDGDAGQRAVLRGTLDVILRLLHPVAPFITEALFEQLSAIPAARVAGIELESKGLLCVSSWPKVDGSLIDAAAEEQFEEVRSIVSAIRNVRSEHQVPPKRRVVLHCSAAMASRMQQAAPGLVEHLAGLAAVRTDKPSGAAGTQVAFRAGGEEMMLSDLADAGEAVDAGAERERLEKQLADLRKNEGALHGRLSNPGYAEKAPAKLVAESRAQLDKIRGEIVAIEAKLKAM